MISDCRLQIEAACISYHEVLSFLILNLHSKTGNPPEGWESEGQIYNRRDPLGPDSLLHFTVGCD